MRKGYDRSMDTSLLARFALVVATALPAAAFAQVAVTAAADQEKLLASTDPRAAANKRLVYDFWREVFEGAHMEFADKYMAESYIQHNPNVPTGRAFFSSSCGSQLPTGSVRSTTSCQSERSGERRSAAR